MTTERTTARGGMETAFGFADVGQGEGQEGLGGHVSGLETQASTCVRSGGRALKTA